MSRFKLAITILSASTASLSEAFTASSPGQSTNHRSVITRHFVPYAVGSYLDSLSAQPSKETEPNQQDETPQPDVLLLNDLKEEISSETEALPVPETGTLMKQEEEEKEQPPPPLGEAVQVAPLSSDTATVMNALMEQDNKGNESSNLSSSNEDQDMRKDEKSPDEMISMAIAAAAKSTLGTNTSRNYRTTRQTLRDSKLKNEKRLSRSTYEKEKTAEKIASIRARMQEQIRNAELELEEKLSDLQSNFDQEMLRIKSLLASQIKIEKSREEKISSLAAALQEAISQKSALIQSEDKITSEMVEVRSKLKSGNISSQLDSLIEQKRQVATFEQAQLDDLMEFVKSAEVILQDTRDRSAKIQNALDNVSDVDVKQPGEARYDFSELEQLEDLWESAAMNAEAENIKILQLKNKFDDELLNKVLLLGEQVPEYLQAAASRLAIRKEAAAQVAQQREMAKQAAMRAASSPSSSTASSVDRSEDNFDAKDDYELLGIVAKSLSSAAIDSAKAGVFGIRAVLDTVKEKEVSQKMPSEKDLEENSMKAIGEAGKTIVSSVSKSESAAQANNALRETGSDLGFAFKAITALGKKAAERLKDQDKK